MLSILKALWVYRGFILGSVKREFQSKYRNSMLGATWTVINPLSMIIVYTVIFSQVMHSRLSEIDSSFGYSIYLCAGILTWGLFSEILVRGQNVFLEHANLLKKLSFPRLCLPVVVVINAGLNFSIIFSLFTVFLIISGNFPGWVWFSIFPVLIVQVFFAIGLAMVLGVLNVFFRDVGQFFNIFLQFWFWFTPIIYPASILPEHAKSILVLNPMAPLVQAYQSILVNGHGPDWISLIPVAIIAFILCALGMHLFRWHVGEMVDEL